MTRQRWTVSLLAGLTLAGCQGSPTTAPPVYKSPPPEPLGPVVRVKDKEIHTAIEDTAKIYDYTFAVSNVGDQPLELKLTRKSCWCTEVEMPKEPVAPGKTGNVVFHWSPMPATPPSYTSSAEIQTNDPKTPLLRLQLKASVNPLVRLSPPLPYLDFLSLRPGQTGELALTVFSTKLPDFELTASASPALAITTEKLAEGAAVEEVRALSGYRLVLKTTDQLPTNYFRDDLVLTVKVPNQEPRKLSVPVYALRESGAFSILPTQVEFRKPQITEADSKKVLVKFIAPSEADRVEVVKVEPPFLTATPPARVGTGEWLFEVKLPRDNPEAAKFQPDGFMEGRVLLKLSGTASDVPVRVKWEPESK
jgi:hypothetical protein